ncbi:MAG TPA: phosphoenolpyruvate carboxykinase (ATP) [Pirellulales bacterium]|jgi:phosphoenolpyruvate carboxykinase (ATP)|nr:phosphoenolpyruvate carboxykinase (ATP) [Pirellulales bacterium]
MMQKLDLSARQVYVTDVLRNAPPARLYEEAIKHDRGVITASGALLSYSGSKTGRSPKDKRIVEHPDSAGDVWWGPINIPLAEQSFFINRQRAVDYLNIRPRIYVVDGYAGWDPKYRLKVRVICARPYHALFMHNMLIRPTPAELADFGDPDYVIYNAGEFPANPYTKQMTSKTSIELSFETKEFVILGSEYAGEMKKGIFTLMHYLMPKQGVLSMHCSANEGAGGDVSLFFGLSGTGKTTLSADPRRKLIGDDEHCWTDEGVFNIEGGCYAKCIHLRPDKEPEIHAAIRFGAILENCEYDEETRKVDYESDAFTENTRAAYPIESIANAKIPCIGGHPKNVILLTCDAFGVLPPVSRLTPAQAMYHFISGYTAKIAGTEVGITEPTATFSACFGAAFLVWHPTKYAEMLAQRMQAHGAQAWLVNTGWSGGAYGVGARLNIEYTRAMIDAIHHGDLQRAPTIEDPIFGLQIPTACPGVPSEVLIPWNTWPSRDAHQQAARKLAALFQKNFDNYRAEASDATCAAGPRAG